MKEASIHSFYLYILFCLSGLHNQVSIGFHRSAPKVLAQSSGVIRNLLEQNHWLPRTSHSLQTYSGVTFDHDRAATQFDAQQLAETHAASISNTMPDYSSAEYQQLKQQKGLLHMDMCQAAMECGMDIAEVQREIVRLKVRRVANIKSAHHQLRFA